MVRKILLLLVAICALVPSVLHAENHGGTDNWKYSSKYVYELEDVLSHDVDLHLICHMRPAEGKEIMAPKYNIYYFHDCDKDDMKTTDGNDAWHFRAKIVPLDADGKEMEGKDTAANPIYIDYDITPDGIYWVSISSFEIMDKNGKRLMRAEGDMSKEMMRKGYAPEVILGQCGH